MKRGLRTRLLPVALAAVALWLPPAGVAAQFPGIPSGILGWGSAGPSVAVLQQDLAGLGYGPGPVDGIFGPLTQGAVTRFQKDHGLAADGVVGPATESALAAASGSSSRRVDGPIGSVPLQPGDVGSAVTTLQGDLWQFGYDPGAPDGVFGPQTQQALMAFQRDRGLPATGVLDGATLAAVVKALGLGSQGGGSPAPAGGSVPADAGSPAPSSGSAPGGSGASGSGSSGAGPSGSASLPAGFTHLEFWARYGDYSDPYPLKSLQAHAGQIGFLSPYWLDVNADGTVSPRESDQVHAQVMQLAHAAGERVLISVQDQHGAAAQIATPEGRQKLAQAILSYIKAWGADGVMVDFEDLPQSSRDDLTAFVATLHGLTFTGISVPAKTQDVMGWYYQDTFDFPALGKAADLIQLMTYDDHGTWSGPGPVAPIDWVQQVAQYTASRIDPKKVLLGIPTYGYDWSSAGANYLPTREFDSLAQACGATPALDPSSDEVHFQCTDKQGVQHNVWGLNLQGVADRVQLARRLGFGGVSVWMLGDEPDSFWSVLPGQG